MSLKFIYNAFIGSNLVLSIYGFDISNINGADIPELDDEFEFPTFEINQIPNHAVSGTADLGISEETQSNETFTVITHDNKTIQYTKTDGYWRYEGCEIIGSDEVGDFYGLGKFIVNGTWDINGTDDESGDRRRLNPFEGTQFARWPNGIIPVDKSRYPGGFPEQLWREIVNEYTKAGISIIDRTNEIDYIELIDGGGCYADVGRFGGRQIMSLQNPGCLALNIAGIIASITNIPYIMYICV